MKTEDSGDQICPFCRFRLKNFAELQDHIVTYHETELKKVEITDDVLTEAFLEKEDLEYFKKLQEEERKKSYMKHERILIEKGFLIKPALEVHTIPLKGFRKKKLLRKAMEILKKTDIDYWYLDEKNWNLIIRADPKTAKVVREKLMAKR